MEEQWKPIPGFDGYEASSLGRIRSVDRVAHGPKKSKRIRGRIRKLYVHNNYQAVHLSIRGKGIARRVHVLVLLAFVGPCPRGMECRHLDGNPLNNRPENLRWGTKSENTADAFRHGTHYLARLTPDQHSELGRKAAGAVDRAYATRLTDEQKKQRIRKALEAHLRKTPEQMREHCRKARQAQLARKAGKLPLPAVPHGDAHEGGGR